MIYKAMLGVMSDELIDTLWNVNMSTANMQ